MVRSFVLALAILIGLMPTGVLAQTTASKPVLTIYTYDAFAADWGPGGALKKGFEKTCGCTVDFVSADSSIGALRRVQLEGKSTKADIVLGLDTSSVAEAEATGLFAKSDVDTSKLDVPTGWSDPEFVPFDYAYLAFVYNKQKLQTPPHSFKDLIAEPKNFKIVIEDPRSSTPGLALVLWIKAAYGDKAVDIWKGLAPHILTVTPDWSTAYNLFLKGEADMVLSYTTSPAYHEIEEHDDRYAAAKFDEGHYMQIEVAGILKSSPHKTLAREFLSYLISPEGQKIIPYTNWAYTVAKLPGGTPKGFEHLVDPKPVLFLPDKQVRANATKWMNEALAVLN